MGMKMYVTIQSILFCHHRRSFLGVTLYPRALGMVKAILGSRLRKKLQTSAPEQGAGSLASFPSLNNLRDPRPCLSLTRPATH